MSPGGLALNRRRDQAFSAEDIRTAAGVAAMLAEGIRRSILRGAAAADDPEGPGLVVLDARNRILSRNAAAKRWLDDIVTVPEPTAAAPYPMSSMPWQLVRGRATMRRRHAYLAAAADG